MWCDVMWCDVMWCDVMSDVTWSSASVGFWPQYLRTALSWLVLMLPSPLQSCWMKASWNFPICSELRWEFSIFLLWGTSLTPHTTVKDLPYTSLNRSIPTGSDSIGLYVAFYYSSRTLSKHSPLITVYNSVRECRLSGTDNYQTQHRISRKFTCKSRWNWLESDQDETGMVRVMSSCPFPIIYIPCHILIYS